MKTALIASASAVLVAACGSLPTSQPIAEARLEARSGSTASGTVSFAPAGGKVRVEARLSGLTPGAHGFHVHEVGDCSAADAASAKGHFNPAGKTHGHQSGEHHAGDMPNLDADANGNASLVVEVEKMAIVEGPGGIVGRSVVVHADPDDYKSQPAGNSGKRVACGVIRMR